MTIEPVTAATFDLVLPLIADYQRFYRATPDAARNRAHFARFLDDHTAGIQFLARDDDGRPFGFATLFFPFGSVAAGARCPLNDLYAVPAARGRGVGRALIRHCAGYARSRGFASISWQTEQSNAIAQRLYDSLPATRAAWYTYTLPVDQIAADPDAAE